MLLSTAINSVVIKSNSCKAYLGRVTAVPLRITRYALRFISVGIGKWLYLLFHRAVLPQNRSPTACESVD